MKNKIKEGDLVEYQYPPEHLFRTFGLVERTEKDKVMVQWLWTENLEGEIEEGENQLRQNYLISYNLNEEGFAWQLRLVA
jgi:hypothetical protein